MSFWMVISSNGIRTKPKHNIVFEKLNFWLLVSNNYLLNFGLVGSGNKNGGASFKEDSP